MPDREKEYIVKKLQEALEKAENDGCFYAEIRRPIVFDAIALLKEQQKLIDDITQRRANNGAFD